MSTRRPVVRTHPAMASEPFIGRFLTLLVLFIQYLLGLFFDGVATFTIT